MAKKAVKKTSASFKCVIITNYSVSQCSAYLFQGQSVPFVPEH